MKGIFQKRYIQVSLLLVVVLLSYQNCGKGIGKFGVADPSKTVDFQDINGNGVDDSVEFPPQEAADDGANSTGPISEKNSQYKICNLSSENEPYKFSDLVEFGGTVDLPGFRLVQYDIVDQSQTNYALRRINVPLRDYLKNNFEKAGLKNSDFLAMVAGDIYNRQTGKFQPVSQENMAVLRAALTLNNSETGRGDLLPLPGFFFPSDPYAVTSQTELATQEALEGFVGNLRFSHITSVMPGLIGHVLLYTEFLNTPKSIARRAKLTGHTLDTSKTLEVPSHKVCYLPQYDGSILERNPNMFLVKGDTIRVWNDAEGNGLSNYGRRVERCFHDETKKCVSDNWLHRPNGVSDKLYNVEIQ